MRQSALEAWNVCKSYETLTSDKAIRSGCGRSHSRPVRCVRRRKPRDQQLLCTEHVRVLQTSRRCCGWSRSPSWPRSRSRRSRRRKRSGRCRRSSCSRNSSAPTAAGRVQLCPDGIGPTNFDAVPSLYVVLTACCVCLEWRAVPARHVSSKRRFDGVSQQQTVANGALSSREGMVTESCCPFLCACRANGTR